MTLLGEGATWTDQQWLAQLVFYGAHELAGMRLVVVLDVALVLLALGLAAGQRGPRGRRLARRSDRAPRRPRRPVGLDDPRAVGCAPPLRRAALAPGGRRIGTACGAHASSLPLLVVWANLHGSVVLGAALTMLLAVAALVRRRGAGPLYPLALLVAPRSACS